LFGGILLNYSAKVMIDSKVKKFPVSPSLYGLFFEEINRAGDGGIYGELIRNRSFEDTIIPDRCHVDGCELHSPAGWVSPKTNQVIVKLVNSSEYSLKTLIDVDGKEQLVGKQIILTSENPNDLNTMEESNKVIPVETTLQLDSNLYDIPSFSVVILKIEL
jgi:alpha-L-arabinofuranosidase